MTAQQIVSIVARNPSAHGINVRDDDLQDMYVSILSSHRTWSSIDDAVAYGLASVRHAHARQARRHALMERGLRLLAPLMETVRDDSDDVDVRLSVERLPMPIQRAVWYTATGHTVRTTAALMALSSSRVQQMIDSARRMLA